MGQELTQRMKVAQDRRFMRMGELIALSSGITFGIHTALLAVAATLAVMFQDATYVVWYLALASLNELIATIWLTLNNIREGKLKEVWRSYKTFPGKMAVLGGILGGPIANGAFLVGIAMAGAAYAVPISALKAVISVILAAIILKQKINGKVWFGIAICVIGAILISYSPPEGNPENFGLGLLFAFIAAAGWGVEGMLAAYGSAVLDTKAIINLRYIGSTVVCFAIMLPLIGGFPAFFSVFPQGSTLIVLIVAAGFAGMSFLQWYKGNAMCGVAKGAALNGTYVFWGVLFTMLFLMDFSITPLVAIGSVAVLIGATIVSLKA